MGSADLRRDDARDFVERRPDHLSSSHGNPAHLRRVGHIALVEQDGLLACARDCQQAPTVGVEMIVVHNERVVAVAHGYNGDIRLAVRPAIDVVRGTVVTWGKADKVGQRGQVGVGERADGRPDEIGAVRGDIYAR